MKKLNIAEILRDCPKGMELDCTMFDDVYFDYIDDVSDIINCYIQNSKHKTGISFNKYGHYSSLDKAKCVIFPKGKTTWEGFQRPFKNGDIITCTNSSCTFVAIYNCMKNEESFYRHACLILNEGMHFSPDNACSDFTYPRFATEEEKQKLFDAIKANGYKWNAETKTLEKLIEPKFKVGDRVLWNYDTKIPRTISRVKFASKRGYVYWIDCEGCSSGWWDETELTLIPNKFDISTLRPFDKVLMRDSNKAKWVITFFSHCNNLETYKYSCVNGAGYAQCIPYEGNEHLLGTTNDCDEYYENW